MKVTATLISLSERVIMANNIWLVAELTIAQGKTETFKERMKTLIELVHSNEPETTIFELYFNDDETKCYPF